MPTDDPRKRGYNLISPGLELPEFALDSDVHVQCLTYLMHKIPELYPIPPEAKLELIPLQYLGGPYPAIGTYSDEMDDHFADLASELEDVLKRIISEIGSDRLRELASSETCRWQYILRRFGE